MSSRTLKRIAAVLCLAAALAVPVHALPARSAEPLGFGDRLLTWAAELLSAVWAQDAARVLLWSNLGRYERHGGRMDHLKLQGLWGLINAGLGKLDEAARDFEAERKGLQEEGVSYTASVASLDLAAVYFEQGRVAETETVAFEALAVFQEMDVPEQARLSVLVLQKALELRLASVDLLSLLRCTAKFLRRIEHDSTAVFDPNA